MNLLRRAQGLTPRRTYRLTGLEPILRADSRLDRVSVSYSFRFPPMYVSSSSTMPFSFRRHFPRHRVADAVRHEPSRLVLFDIQHPHKLMRAHALLPRGTEQVNRQQPFVKRNVAESSKMGLDRDGELLAASGALPQNLCAACGRACQPHAWLRFLLGGLFLDVDDGRASPNRPQCGQTGPSGQRIFSKYSRALSSS